MGTLKTQKNYFFSYKTKKISKKIQMTRDDGGKKEEKHQKNEIITTQIQQCPTKNITIT